MTVRVTAAASRSRTSRSWRLPVALVVALLGGLILLLQSIGGRSEAPALPRTKDGLSRRAAVQRAVDVLVRSGAAGASDSRALRTIYSDSFVDGRGADAVVRAAERQRIALVTEGPSGARVLERTVPVGYRLTRFDAKQATVLVWSLHVAGPDRGRRAPGAWWLTTRMDLVPRDAKWRIAKAVAVQGPTPRLIKPQQGGVGRTSDLRLMLDTTQRLHGAP